MSQAVAGVLGVPRVAIGMEQIKAFVGAYLGYALDAMDFLLLSMIMPLIIADLNIPLPNAALLFSATLLGAFVGGVIFGIVSDRIGRVKTMMITILGYSVFTALCGLAPEFTTLLVLRFLVGLFLGGEWGAGAALVTEVWPPEWRGRIGGMLISSWQVGTALAAAITLFIAPAWGWRAVFFLGVIPALLAVWVRLSVKESPVWEETRRTAERPDAPAGSARQSERLDRNPLVDMFSGDLRARAILVSVKMGCTLFVLWGILAWLPTVLASPPRNLSTARSMEYILVLALGNLVGQIIMGFLMDQIGRKKAFLVVFALGAVMLVIYPNVLDLQTLFWLGFAMGLVVFAPMGGIAAYTGELFPTRMRGTAINWGMGFGRGVSILAPIFLAALAPTMGLGGAFVTLAAFYVVAFLAVLGLPETKGTEFQPG
jgi:MFS family permease